MADQRELTWKLSTDAGNAAKDIESVDKAVDGVKSKMEDVDKKSGVFSKIGKAGQTLGAGFNQVGSQISAVGGNIAKTGAKITALTAPIALGLKRGVDGALELDTAIRQVSTLADSEILPVSKIESEVRRISDATGIMQTEISQSMYDALSSGIDSADVVGFVEQGVKLTKAGFTDMPTVIDATTTALNAYGLSGQEATAHIQDVFVKTQDLGKITVDELGKNIGRVVPFASAAGVSIDQLGAGYSILTAKGQNAAIATTNLSALISELNTTGSKADKALRSGMGKSFKELMDSGASLADVLGSLQGVAEDQGLQLGDMFANKMATSAANTLLADGPGQFNEALDAMVNSAGTVDANYEKMMGPAEKLQIAQTKLKNSMIEMGAALVPVLEKVANKISEMAEKFNSLDSETKGKIAKVAGALVVIGPLITGIGTALMVVGGVIKAVGTAIALLTNPIGLVVAAVAAVAAVGYLVYQNWDLIKAKATEVWDGVKTKVSETVDGMKLKIDEFKMAASEKFESVKASVSEKWEGIKLKTSESVEGMKMSVETFRASASEKFESLRANASEKLNSIKTKASEMADGMAAKISGAIETSKGMFTSLRSTASSAIEGIKSAWNTLKETLSKPINAVVNFGKGIVNGAKNMLNPHSDGLYRVPYDEYPAMLHKNEMVVTSEGSSQLRAMGATENGFTKPMESVTNNYNTDSDSTGVLRDIRPNVSSTTNNQSESSVFSPTVNVTVNADGNDKGVNPYLIADVVKEELMALFNTATLQRG